MGSEEQEFQALSEYLAGLQAGERPDRQGFLRAHPELASALDCLEVLENMAPAPGQATLPVTSQDTAVSIHGDPPPSLGKYQLLSEIGRGGMGVVYKARQEDLDRVVAIKMILANRLASPDDVRRFQAEARAAAKLRHSHIVPIHEVGQCNGQDFFAMEYIEGQSLAQRIQAAEKNQSDVIDVPTAVRIVSSIARATDYLHQQGIVHRDLKPSNILLDEQGEPYLTDFGLAKFFGPDAQRTATGVIAGTPAYMAPEQASGRGNEITPAVDIYSLGAILYELLTGQAPFCADNPLDVLLSVLSVDPILPRRLNPKIPRELELICMTCLRKSPGERYASAAELADDLERFAKGVPIKVPAPGLAQRFLGWTRRNPALAARLGALTMFYAVDCVNYLGGAVDLNFHLEISAVIAIWILGSIVCQRLVQNNAWSMAAPFIWGTLDSILFLIVLLVADGAASPLVVGYMLLIVGAGLWFRVRFVFYMAVLSLLSYGVLMLDFYLWRPWLHAPGALNLDRHAIFAVSLAILASIISYLVRRVRILSSFYGR